MVPTSPRPSASSPAKVEVKQRENGSETGTVRTRNQVEFDGHGRPVLERRLKSGEEWAERATERDAMGHVTRVSEWALDGAADPALWRVVGVITAMLGAW